MVVTAAAVLAACGGGGESEPAATEPGTTTEAADPREGYFTSAESEALNPPLGEFTDAWNAYLESGEACNDEAQRLFDGGASPRRAVRCHLDENRALVDATAAIRTALDGVTGEYRDECDAGIERFAGSLEETETARQQVLDGYERYAESGTVAPRLQERSTRADELSAALIDEELVALSAACYIEEDLQDSEG